MEKRFFSIEMRAGEGDAPKLQGYAAVFNSFSQVLFGRFKERIERGAFAGSLGEDVRALWNHNPDFPLARTTNGTLKLAEDGHGLRVEINPPNTQIGRDAVTSIQRGDVDQMSFAFDVLDDEWDQEADGMLIRTLKKVRLYEVSPVTFPAYTQTSIEGRSMFGDQPVIPTNLGGRSGGNGDAERAQARTATRRRRLATIL